MLFKRQAGPHRPDHRAVPAPPRVARLRHPDRRRHPLPLSRLGVRPRRPMPRAAERAGEEPVPQQGEDAGLRGRGNGRLFWAYLGPAESKPLLPRIDGFVTDGTIRMLGRALVPVNWLQIMENSLDPVHTEWLHGHTYEFIKEQKGQGHKVAISAHHEKIAFREFEHGITKHRLLTGHSEDCDDWKVGHPVVFPNILSVGNGDEQSTRATTRSRSACRWTTRTPCISGTRPTCRRRAPRCRSTCSTRSTSTTCRYQDKNGDFILDNVDGQDMMAWSRKAPIADRTQENLGASDNGIALYRRVLRREIKKVEEGIDPMFTFRDPAKNARIDLPNERKKHHNSEGARSWIMRTHAALFADRRGRVPDVRGHQARARAAAGGRLSDSDHSVPISSISLLGVVRLPGD